LQDKQTKNTSIHQKIAGKWDVTKDEELSNYETKTYSAYH